MKEDRSSKPLSTPPDDRGFHIECLAGEAGLLRVATETVSFTVAQRIVVQNKSELFESVRVRCQKEDDGSLTVQVLIWAPDLDGPLQIAHLRSRSSDRSTVREPLERDLNHKMLG